MLSVFHMFDQLSRLTFTLYSDFLSMSQYKKLLIPSACCVAALIKSL